jgi:hypothetical protein
MYHQSKIPAALMDIASEPEGLIKEIDELKERMYGL